MNYRQELYRKFIHIAWAIIPLLYYYYLDKRTMIWILGIGTAVVFLGELLRMWVPIIGRLFDLIFGKIIRESEDTSFTGATYTLLGSFLTVLIFEKEIAIASLLILVLADSSAALLGRKWGKTPLLGKSVEGTITFFIVATVIVLVFPGLSRIPAFLGAVVATAVELFPSPVNDNLMIPLAAAVTMSLGHLIA